MRWRPEQTVDWIIDRYGDCRFAQRLYLSYDLNKPSEIAVAYPSPEDWPLYFSLLSRARNGLLISPGCQTTNKSQEAPASAMGTMTTLGAFR